MNVLRFFLVFSTFVIYIITAIAIANQGVNWPAITINDLMSLNWRTQFDIDFIIHLFLLATWVIWREGATKKAYLFGVLSIVMGGMFSFPYIIYASFIARGNPKTLLLGTHAKL